MSFKENLLSCGRLTARIRGSACSPVSCASWKTSTQELQSAAQPAEPGLLNEDHCLVGALWKLHG